MCNTPILPSMTPASQDIKSSGPPSSYPQDPWLPKQSIVGTKNKNMEEPNTDHLLKAYTRATALLIHPQKTNHSLHTEGRYGLETNPQPKDVKTNFAIGKKFPSGESQFCGQKHTQKTFMCSRNRQPAKVNNNITELLINKRQTPHALGLIINEKNLLRQFLVLSKKHDCRTSAKALCKTATGRFLMFSFVYVGWPRS